MWGNGFGGVVVKRRTKRYTRSYNGMHEFCSCGASWGVRLIAKTSQTAALGAN